MTSSNKPSLWSSDFIKAFIANLLMFFAFYLLVPVLPFFVIDELKASSSIAGIVLSIYTVAALVIRPFSGYLVDTFARKPLYILCYGLFTAVFAGYLIASALTFFIILRILHGMAFGITSISGNTIAVDIMPSERRGEGIGYFGMAANLAMAIGPMSGIFIYHKYSFNATFFISLMASAIGFFIATTIHSPQKTVQPTNELMSLDRFFLLKGIPQVIVLSTISFGYGIVSNYIGIYCSEVGFAESAGFFFTIQALGIVGARMLSAKAINKGKIISLVYVGVLCLIIGYLLFLAGHSLVLFYLSALLLGLGYGYTNPASQTMFINLAAHNRRGTANSTYYTAWDLGLGIGIMAGGNLIGRFGFSTLFIFCIVIIIIGTLFFKLVAAPYFEKHKLR